MQPNNRTPQDSEKLSGPSGQMSELTYREGGQYYTDPPANSPPQSTLATGQEHSHIVTDSAKPPPVPGHLEQGMLRTHEVTGNIHSGLPVPHYTDQYQGRHYQYVGQPVGQPLSVSRLPVNVQGGVNTKQVPQPAYSSPAPAPAILTPEWAHQMNQMMSLQLQQQQQLTRAMQQMATQFTALASRMPVGQQFVTYPTDVSSGVSSQSPMAPGLNTVTRFREAYTGTDSTNRSSSGYNQGLTPESQDLPENYSDRSSGHGPSESHRIPTESNTIHAKVPPTRENTTAEFIEQRESYSEVKRDPNLTEKIDNYFRKMNPPTISDPFEDDETSVSSMRTSTTGSSQSKHRHKKGDKIIHDAHKIHQKLRDGAVGKQLNILLLGMPGVGKSSLLNSMVMALNNRGYKEISVRGSYGAGGRDGRSAVTLTIKGLPVFSSVLFKDSPELKYECQPVFYDCPGLPDTDDKNISNIVRLILDGKMKDRTNVSDLLHVNEKEVKKKFSKTEKSREIHIVLVVHAATDPVPEALLRSIRDALTPEETSSRAVPMLAVITKTDQLPSLSDLDEIEQTIAGELGMTGATERIICSKLYCNEVTPGLKRDEEIDANMCRIWDYILRPELVNTRQRVSRMSSILKR